MAKRRGRTLEKPGIWVFELVGGKKEHLVASNEFGEQDLTGQSLPIFVVGRVCGSRR